MSNDARPEAGHRRTRLGKILVDHGWVTGEQLLRAIQSQRAIGGRIGTCLLEMDALSEDRLLDALAEQTGVPTVRADGLRRIEHDVLALLPASLAASCRAVPFAADGDELHVAILDGTGADQLEAIASRTRKRVAPHVASEVRLLEALERHYGIECPRRYGELLSRLNRFRDETAIDRTSSGSYQVGWSDAMAPAVVPLEGRESKRSALGQPGPARPLRAKGAKFKVRSRQRGPMPAPASQLPTPRPVPVTKAPVVVPEPPTRSKAPPAKAPRAKAPRAKAPQAETPTPETLAGLSQRLATVTETRQVGEILVGFLADRFVRAAVFKVRVDAVVGWFGTGPGFQAKRFEAFELDLDRPSVFSELKQGFPFHRGTLESNASHQALFACWGQREGWPCAVFPVWVRKRLVAVLYGDRGDAGLVGVDLDELDTVAARAALGFELCILRRKLLQGG